MNERLRKELFEIMKDWPTDRIKKFQQEVLKSKKKYDSDKDILMVGADILQE